MVTIHKAVQFLRGSTFAVAVAALAAIVPASAQDDEPIRKEIFDLDLGMNVDDLDDLWFQEYGCGDNGGPPLLTLAGWSDFRKCGVDEFGLFEIYFRYDDEVEYWARAHALPTRIELYSGTTAYSHPLIISVLVDNDGVIRVVRMITDWREELRFREAAWRLERFVRPRYRIGDEFCQDLEQLEGETDVGGLYIKRRCEKKDGKGRLIVIQTHLFRKPGQLAFDPHTLLPTEGEFESLVRVEIWDTTLVR